MVAEVTLSVVLVIGAGLLLKSFAALRSVDPGFHPEQVLKVQYELPASRYPMDFSKFPDFPEILEFTGRSASGSPLSRVWRRLRWRRTTRLSKASPTAS